MAIHLSLEASKVFWSPGSCMDGVPPCLRGEAPIEMEAVAPGEDHYYLYHKPLSARPVFYDDNFEQPDVSQGFALPDSGDVYGPYQRTDVQPVDGDGNGFLKPSISVSSKDPMYNARDKVDANGYSFGAAGEVSQRLACDSDSKRDVVIGKHAPVHVDKSDNLYQSDSVNTRCIGELCRSNCKPDDKDQVLNSIGTGNIKDDEDYDVDNAQEIPGNRIVPLESQEHTEILESNASQCYSPGEWSSHVSTDSPEPRISATTIVAVSTSASPLPAGSFSPVFNRCKTAPIEGASSSHVDMEERSPNFTRFKTNQEKKPKLAETSLHAPSPAEKLSERKRVWAPNTWCLGVMFWSLRSHLAEASYYRWLLKKIIENLVRIKNDGTVEVDVDRGSEFTPALFDLDVPDQAAASIEEDFTDPTRVIPAYLEIAMLIVGTRGDVQPFVAIGKRLKEKGHRVRLATHANFRTFVTSNGLEFYPLGGDPKILAGYMVKNKGFLPSGPSELSIQRKQLKAIMNSLLPACTKADGESGAPFRADAIIANPPAYGHIHVAECLDVPIHIFFTMPWTPTNEFPHPLARVKQQAGYKLTYHVVDSLMWWGIRGLINEFRVKELNLNPMNYFNMSQESIAHLPTGYMWSPLLVPKPKDWGPRVDVVGFCFLNVANDYKPLDDLVKWLAAGEKPIYVGFGSIPLEQPGKMTEVIIQALQETKQRGIIDKGWGGLGIKEIPDSIFLLENCPHDWLFPRCAAVVHHGGAGTTAAGLKAGCPTTIVPFFGDQPFWGERVCAKGVGPPPIPVQQFSLERLVHAINFMKDSEVKQRALELAKQMEEEDGVEGAVDAFYRHWVKRPPQGSFTAQPPSFIQAILIRLQKFWCLPCCFE